MHCLSETQNLKINANVGQHLQISKVQKSILNGTNWVFFLNKATAKKILYLRGACFSCKTTLYFFYKKKKSGFHKNSMIF